MASGSSIREKKELLLDSTFKKIGQIYSGGLYEFIESKPAYYEELIKLEEKIDYICSSDIKSVDELRKELSKYYGIHQRASKAYEIIGN